MTKEQRDHAKQLTYGLLYGMGPAKLADELGCSVGEAKDAQVGWLGGWVIAAAYVQPVRVWLLYQLYFVACLMCVHSLPADCLPALLPALLPAGQVPAGAARH